MTHSKKITFISLVMSTALMSGLSVANASDYDPTLGHQPDEQYFNSPPATDTQPPQTRAIENRSGAITLDKDINIQLHQKGWYIASMSVSYQLNGQYHTEQWDYIGGGQYRTAHIPKGSTNVSIRVSYSDGFFYSDIFAQTVTQNVYSHLHGDTLEYEVWGSIFDRRWRLVP